MIEFLTVTRAELEPVLGFLVDLPERVTMDALPGIVGRLGWTLQTRRVGITSLPVSLKIFLAGDLDNPGGNGELVSLSFRITDTLSDESRASKRLVASVTPKMIDVVSSCLGFPPTRPLWAGLGQTWDLPNGKQVNLDQGDDTIVLQVWAKRRADIERHEISQGVDPAHDLDDRPS